MLPYSYFHYFIFFQFLTLPLMFMIFDKLSRILEKEILQIFREIKRHKLNWSARNCWSYKSQKNFLLSFLSIFSSFLSFNATLRMNEKSIVITRAGQNGGFKKMSLTNKKKLLIFRKLAVCKKTGENKKETDWVLINGNFHSFFLLKLHKNLPKKYFAFLCF